MVPAAPLLPTTEPLRLAGAQVEAPVVVDGPVDVEVVDRVVEVDALVVEVDALAFEEVEVVELDEPEEHAARAAPVRIDAATSKISGPGRVGLLTRLSRRTRLSRLDG